MNDRSKTVVVIGGATVDIEGFAGDDLIERTSNPGRISVSAGGVGRNIAENLARLGVRTKLITAVGNDDFGKQAVSECRRAGIDVAHTKMLDGYTTSAYLALHDKRGEMVLAISQLDAVEAIDSAFIAECAAVIQKAQIVVLDTNISEKTIVYILKNFPEAIFFIDPVSIKKSPRIKHVISCCHTIKPDKQEAETLSGITIHGMTDLEKIVKYFLTAGVSRVFITLGSEGVFYGDERACAHLPSIPTDIVSDTGAGDAFTAGLVYSHLNGYDIEKSAKLATAVASLTLENERTVNPNLSVEQIEERMGKHQ